MQKALLSRVLPRIGAGCLFQTLTNWSGYSFHVAGYLQHRYVELEMHALPQHVILDLLPNTGLQIREAVSDGWVDHYGSNTLFAAKREYCR